MDEPLYTWGNRWFRVSVVSLIVLAVLALLIGFVWLPSVHADFSAQGLWARICRAAGVPTEWSETKAPVKAGVVSTSVVLEPALAKRQPSDAVGRGATLALQQCTMCHGAKGVSAADTPNLAGQYQEVVIKQLVDYKNGSRPSTVMQALARSLSEQQIEEVAAYYASLPKERRTPAPYSEPAPALVRVGDPMRNIAPCASCHGGIDRKLGTPWLEGMPKQYLIDQLRAFSSATRHNDSYGQMRNMARLMTAKEIDQVADFYARHGESEGTR